MRNPFDNEKPITVNLVLMKSDDSVASATIPANNGVEFTDAGLLILENGPEATLYPWHRVESIGGELGRNNE